MKISDIPVKEEITSAEIQEGYTLGMKNVYPNDDTPVLELRKFPLSAYLSDIDMKTAENLVKRIRDIKSEVDVKKTELQELISNIKTVTLDNVEAANLQKLKDTISYDEVTTQLTSKFVSPEEFQTTVNNVYAALFKAVEEMMVQVFTTSMYARQYVPIYEEATVTYTPPKEVNETN